MATQLTVYNSALALLGQTPLTSVDQNNEDGRHLSEHWQPVVDLCHEKTAWDFARVKAELARQPTGPTFGYTYYYAIPSDCLRILHVSTTGSPRERFTDWEVDTTKLATNAETVYLSYVSETSRNNVGRWSESFAYYVACELALRCAPKINSSAVELIMKERRKAVSDAIGLDATQGPPQRRQHGSWSGAARGYYTNSSNREQS